MCGVSDVITCGDNDDVLPVVGFSDNCGADVTDGDMGQIEKIAVRGDDI